MPAVGRGERLLQQRDAEIGEAARPQAVGFAEVVFRAGALDGVLAVDLDDLVAFAPPAAVVVLDAQHAADEVAAALGVEDQVGALRRRRALAVLGVEIELVRRRLLDTCGS